MYQIPPDKQALALQLLTEGNSLRAVHRLTGLSKDTIGALMKRAGHEARIILTAKCKHLKCKTVQVDEIWTFVQKKQGAITSRDWKKLDEMGDFYVFVALDEHTKLVPHFMVGKRTLDNAATFMCELRKRIDGKFRLATDNFSGYPGAIARGFGDNKNHNRSYENARKIDTNHIERQNLTIRNHISRMRRQTIAYSKSVSQLINHLSLHFLFYNFMWINSAISTTAAIAQGIEEEVWTWRKFVDQYLCRKNDCVIKPSLIDWQSVYDDLVIEKDIAEILLHWDDKSYIKKTNAYARSILPFWLQKDKVIMKPHAMEMKDYRTLVE